MSAILSVFNRIGEAVDRQLVETMLGASSHRAVDGQDAWFDGPIAVAHQHFWITPEEQGERQPLVDGAGRWTISADTRLDNRGELLKSLDLGDREVSDAALILLAYQRWGTACVKRLLGDFAFVIWDADQQHLFVARDALGARGLCYYIDSERCLVSSEVTQILAHPAVEPEVNEGKVADYLAEIWHNHEETLYKNIQYCPPAHCLLISAESVRKWRYWEVDPQKRIRYKDDQEYAAHFLELLTEAVRGRLRTVGPVGISLSGGLDSTTLAAIASGLLPEVGLSQKRVKSFSYVFDELTSCDERHFIQPVVDRYQLDATYIPCDDKWTLRDSHKWPVHKDHIWYDAFVLLPLSVMNAARQEGCRLLMTGYFADALLAGGRYWAAGMMADRRIGQLAKFMVRQRAQVDLRRDILTNGLRHMVPHRLRMAYGRQRSRDMTMLYPSIHPNLAEKTRLGSRLYPDGERRTGFGPDQWHRYLLMTLDTFVQGTSAVRSQYSRYGLELSTPYWDRRLIEYVMAVPADQLGRPPFTKRLLRNAASDLLPKAIRERRQKTHFLPLFEKGLLVKEHDAVERILNDPLIVRQQYVRKDWLRQQMDGGRGWSDRWQSYFLWKCLSLELWLGLLNSPSYSSSII